MLNILDKDFFKSKAGKRLANKYYGYDYSEKPKPEPVVPSPAIRQVRPSPAHKEQVQQPYTPFVGQTGEDHSRGDRSTEVNQVPNQVVKECEIPQQPTNKPDFENMFGSREEKRVAELNAGVESLEKKVNANVPEVTVSSTYIPGENIFVELLAYYHCNVMCGVAVKPVLEEDGNCLLATAGAVDRKSVWIGGESRTGKSLIADKLAEILRSLYPLIGCSDKALTKNAENINTHEHLYVVEMQGALDGNPHVKEAFKCVSEGRDYTYEVNGEIITISGNIAIIGTGADENASNQNQDVEVLGRFIHLKTRPNGDQKKRAIGDYQDKLASGEIEDVVFSKERYERLKKHIDDVLDDTSMTENPFAIPFGKEYLPETKKSVHYRTLYASLINAFTKLSKHNRVRKSNGKLLTSIEDVYLVNKLYHQTYCDTLKRLATQSYNALIKDKGLTDDQKTEMEEQYQAELREIDEKEARPLDWQRLWNSAYGRMKERNISMIDEWVAGQSKDGKVCVYDPMLRRDVYLCDVIAKSILIPQNPVKTEVMGVPEPVEDTNRMLPAPI
jgi:hypothetical protein